MTRPTSAPYTSPAGAGTIRILANDWSHGGLDIEALLHRAARKAWGRRAWVYSYRMASWASDGSAFEWRGTAVEGKRHPTGGYPILGEVSITLPDTPILVD